MIRLAVRCRAEQAERVLAELVEVVPGGVEEDHGAGWVEYAIYGPPGELPELPDLEAAAGEGLVEIDTTEVPDDWADRWRDFHEPVWVADRLLVRPSWEERGIPGAAPEIEVVIDPGRAFGTGAHATTSLCLELLVEQADADPGRGSAADLGTGSGVLAIAAALLGYGPVLACDHERPAVEAARANADLNGVGEGVAVERVDLRRRPPPRATLLLANLTAPVLLAIAPRLVAAPGENAILGGILPAEEERVRAAWGEVGWLTAERRERAGWVALRLQARPT